jgi:hypothetical protein
VAEAHNVECEPQARALRCVLEAIDLPGFAALWVWRGSFRND